MTFTIDSNLIENNRVRLTEDANGDLSIEHIPTGRIITVDKDVKLSSVLSDGDGIERQIWVIENGASDPVDADAEDIILEKE